MTIARTIALTAGFATLIACQTAVKDIAAGAQIILCVDENLDLPVDQIIAKCGPDAANLIEARKALAKKRNPCTTIVVDAGAPIGPGR